MRFKTLIVVSLALLMVVTLAAPALAKPERLYQAGTDPGVGQASIRATKDNNSAVSVSLRKATPGKVYKVVLTATEYIELGELEVGDNGSGRFKGVTSQSWTSGTSGYWNVFLATGDYPSYATWFAATGLYISFK